MFWTKCFLAALSSECLMLCTFAVSAAKRSAGISQMLFPPPTNLAR